MRNRFALAALAVGIVFGVAGGVNAQPNFAWERNFNGPATDSEDQAFSVAVDGSGNVVVAGTYVKSASDIDMIVQKYDATGTLLWSKTFDGGAAVADWDVPTDVKVDGTGNVYVGGYSYFSATDSDGMILKYNSAGTLVWTYRHIPASNNLAESVYSIAVDGSGNVYGGMDLGAAGGNYDAAIVKVTSAGALSWIRSRNGAQNDYDAIYRVALAPNGDVVGAGWSREAGNQRDALIMRVSSTNTLVHASIYSRLAASHEYGNNIVVDSSNNTYLCGESFNTGDASGGIAPSTAFVISYNPTGTVRWTNTYAGAGVGQSAFADVVLDGAGDVYAVGYTQTSAAATSFDCVARKMSNGAGATSWTTTFNGANNQEDFLFDASLSGTTLYAAGFVTVSTSNRDSILLGLNTSTGAVSWNKQYNGAGSDWDVANAMALGADGSVYLAGYSYVTVTNANGMLLRYAPPLVVPSGYQVNYGVETSVPGVARLQANDANSVDICQNLDQEDPNPIQVEMNGTNGNVNPATLKFNVVCRAEANDREIFVEMFNFNVGDWVGSPSVPVTDSDALYTFNAPGTAGQFVNDGDGAMLSRITGFLGAADSPTLPCWSFNYCYWE